MPRLVIFDGLLAGEHTYYEDADTGAVVQVYPGDQVPASKFVDPEHYAVHGYARIEGVEDGTDGRLDRLMDQLRDVLEEIAPLAGPKRRWTLDAMLGKAQELQVADVASREAFAVSAAAEARAIEEIKAQDEAGGGTSEVAPL